MKQDASLSEPQPIEAVHVSAHARSPAVPLSEQAGHSVESLISEVLAESILSEIEDVLGVTSCDCGDVLSAVRTLKAENERLKSRLREYEAELTTLRPLAKKMSEIRRQTIDTP